MIKERPILFSGAMVRAILDGRKSQTRRVVKPQPIESRKFAGGAYIPQPKRTFTAAQTSGDIAVEADYVHLCCPYGQPGDRLWVRETWRPRIVHSCFDMACDCETVWVDYPAGGEGQHFEGDSIPDEWYMPQAAIKGRSVPSLHMPRWASRLELEITGVRVERLNDCSEADAEAEGIAFLREVPDVDETLTARQLYECLWDSINGAGSWEANPWVWVVEFRRIEA